MDENRKKEIDAAWRRSRRVQFFADLKAVKKRWMLLLGLFVAVLVFVGVVYPAPPNLVETLQGRVVGQFAPPSKIRPQLWRVTVQLDGGQTVSFELPRNEILRMDAPMKVAHLRREVGPLTYNSYRFAGYVEEVR
jgi:hypothetical protein